LRGRLCHEMAKQNSPGLQPGCGGGKCALKASPARYAGAIRTKRNTSILPTPSIRVPGFEDEDDDEDEYEAHHEWRPRSYVWQIRVLI
jgi:hypothetical protein